ncbi:hypothetical protein CVV68_01600 [Arthrobacter livingstonensis]|uniref:Uncharacterized protein n=1 Tax=Arthrobacter livingstonensis TaxID=670078 RepID=A0A2V5M2R8_9MICC|nr:hypothetical protein [Arthrobacter livingstonensis]PYI69826.1 hypothetical protein CVV68_01600 [Arthrobacter livingstonensis]
MANKSKYTGWSKDQFMATLRREILAARLKVTLDEQLHRETSLTVKRLANMKLPRMRTPGCRIGSDPADALVRRALDVRAGRPKTVPAAEVLRELGPEG